MGVRGRDRKDQRGLPGRCVVWGVENLNKSRGQ